MKHLFLTLFVLATGFGLVAFVRADSKPATDPYSPGAEHAVLQKVVGTWQAEIVSKGQGGKETRTPGVLTTTAHAGFHTVDSFESMFMGQKFQGHGINGYCTVRKQYFTYWTDSMTSSPLVAYGNYDAMKKELELKGECLGLSGKLEPCRIVTHFVDDDHRTFALYGAGTDGKEFEQLKIEYTRKR